MLVRASLFVACVAAALIPSAPVVAQGGAGPSLTIEGASDQRRRGLSWSDGRASLEARGEMAVSQEVTVGLGVSALRGSARHGGADAGVDLSARYGRELGAWRLSAGVTGHAFPGAASGLAYAEADGRLSYGIGPLQLGLGASYAPAQEAIGGDNLYLNASADAGIPGTPISLYGHVGRSSGRVDDPVRAARLRPQGRYWDYAVGVDYLIGPFAAGLLYSDTTIDAVDPTRPLADVHVGARLTGSIRARF